MEQNAVVKSENDDEMLNQDQIITGPYYHFGEVAFTPEEQERIQYTLGEKLPKDFITWRTGPGGRK